MNATMEKRKVLVVSKELHAQMVALAKAEGRSVYWLTNKLLEGALVDLGHGLTYALPQERLHKMEG
jgi:predicted HicB family RNase H-like nuclease